MCVMEIAHFRTTCLVAFEKPSMETSLVRGCVLPGCLIYLQFNFGTSQRPISVTQLTFLRDGAVCAILNSAPHFPETQVREIVNALMRKSWPREFLYDAR
jgi:hypothetical protein